jgi:hypothetical protein
LRRLDVRVQAHLPNGEAILGLRGAYSDYRLIKMGCLPTLLIMFVCGAFGIGAVGELQRRSLEPLYDKAPAPTPGTYHRRTRLIGASGPPVLYSIDVTTSEITFEIAYGFSSIGHWRDDNCPAEEVSVEFYDSETVQPRKLSCPAREDQDSAIESQGYVAFYVKYALDRRFGAPFTFRWADSFVAICLDREPCEK